MTEPLVSIIIPTFNRAHLIRETLDSVMVQTYKNWECIVVDDGSTDNTDKLMAMYVAKDSRFQYHHRPKDRLPGGNAARNYGFEVSKGEFIQWFDSDDLMMPNKLELKVGAVGDEEINFIVCEGGELVDIKNMSYIKKWQLYQSDQILLEHLKGNLVFGTNGPLFKKQYLENKFLFDEELIISQEWEFFSRLLMMKPKFNIINKVLYVYRNENDGKRKVITREKFANRIKGFSKIISSYKEQLFSKDIDDFEFRKFFFLNLKLNMKRAFKNSYYTEVLSVLILLLSVSNFNLFKESVARIIKKPAIIRKILK